MRKDKETILREIIIEINKRKEQIETLKSLKINKTKNGEYFKTISKKGFEINNKKWAEVGFDTYHNKHYLKYGYEYNAIYFTDFVDLETTKKKNLQD